MEPRCTIAQAFDAAARAHPDGLALICAGKRFTHGQLEDLAERLARGLHRLGVRTGDRVVIFMPHCPQWLASWLAVQRLGAVCVPVSHFYGSDDLEYIVQDCGAHTIVCMDTNIGCVQQVDPAAGLRRAVVASPTDVLDPDSLAPAALPGRPNQDRSPASLDVSVFPELLVDGDQPLPALSVDPAETAELLYTGGTTGVPRECRSRT